MGLWPPRCSVVEGLSQVVLHLLSPFSRPFSCPSSLCTPSRLLSSYTPLIQPSAFCLLSVSGGPASSSLFGGSGSGSLFGGTAAATSTPTPFRTMGAGTSPFASAASTSGTTSGIATAGGGVDSGSQPLDITKSGWNNLSQFNSSPIPGNTFRHISPHCCYSPTYSPIYLTKNYLSACLPSNLSF